MINKLICPKQHFADITVEGLMKNNSSLAGEGTVDVVCHRPFSLSPTVPGQTFRFPDEAIEWQTAARKTLTYQRPLALAALFFNQDPSRGVTFQCIIKPFQPL